MPTIAPSILAADFLNLGAQLDGLKHADSLHLDVMDGHFVPNITFGPDLIAQIRRTSRLPLDVHLMLANPDEHLETFVRAGADCISVHVEVCTHLHRTVHAIRALGAEASVAMNPATPLESLRWILPDVQQVLIMSVNPGFGGQAFIESSIDKLRQLAAWRQEGGWNFRIQVDGGINGDTIPDVVRAGADALVIGSALFDGKHGSPGEALDYFRRLARASEAT